MALIPTLTQYLLGHLSKHPNQQDLVLIMSDLAAIGKYISRETNRAGIAGIRGAADAINIQGEEVQKLDVFANTLCKDYLCRTGHFCAMASEEEDTVVDMRGYGEGARYVIAFDPLDGSSNIDANVSIGTIFSVHKKRDDIAPTSEEQFFQKGREQVLAGYLLYGSSTVLVFSFGDGVHEFTLDQGLGEFLLSNERIMIPDQCPYYSVNEGNSSYFSQKDKEYINYLKHEKKMSSRYIGSFVADFHRNLVKGGIFLYPAIDDKGSGHYKGKLRMNYEVKPLAFLAAQAGGLATDGAQDILDIVPTSLHQRVPLVIGNTDNVQQHLSFAV